MNSRVYEILEALHEDALTEHRERPGGFTRQVLRAVGEALTEIELEAEVTEAMQAANRKRHEAAKKAVAARWGRKDVVKP